MGRFNPLVEEVRLHREEWPLDRLADDPAGFRADCERLLIGFPKRDGPAVSADLPLADHWLDLLFSNPPPAFGIAPKH